jgi:hypothetical protein
LVTFANFWPVLLQLNNPANMKNNSTFVCWGISFIATKYSHIFLMRGKILFNDLLYQGYESSSRFMFDINLKNLKYHPKEKFIGIALDGKAKAYVFSELSKSQLPAKDILNKIPIKIYFDRQTQTAVKRGDKNKKLPAVEGFWFA